MRVVLHNTGTHNSGSMLMAYAVEEFIRACHSAAPSAVSSFSTEDERVQIDWSPRIKGAPKFAADALRRLPLVSALAAAVPHAQPDVIFDASGLAYSDSVAWFAYHFPSLERMHALWKTQKTKIIFLPQTFGPFTSERSRRAASMILDCGLLVYARERASEAHLRAVRPSATNIRLAPDFTNMLAVTAVQPLERVVAIVPNVRMIDYGGVPEDVYVRFLVMCAEAGDACGCRPVIFPFAKGDEGIVRKVHAAFIRQTGKAMQVLPRTDPLLLRKRIGESSLLVGSRYHALACALHQGVPIVAAGWHGKYDGLMQLYDCEESLFPPGTSEAFLRAFVQKQLDPEHRSVLLPRLRSCAERHLRATRQMWQEIASALWGHGEVPHWISDTRP